MCICLIELHIFIRTDRYKMYWQTRLKFVFGKIVPTWSERVIPLGRHSDRFSIKHLSILRWRTSTCLLTLHMTHGIQVGCVLPHSGNLRCNPCRKSVIICSIWSCHHLSPFCVLIMECTISGPFKRFHCPVTRSLVQITCLVQLHPTKGNYHAVMKLDGISLHQR
ncbi:uncharacterized protein LOC125377840 isoform X1 [Haliotis rufescens]|uniref:uncharacterized protein LOC125377840 isoform X1 n=2 Tax=Haliotis rufescens TaxID=6454 RepID=UPI00201E7E4F|nr:uncharacterized protein LOC125377840 isoform X1 [Haliotis rufescens]